MKFSFLSTWWSDLSSLSSPTLISYKYSRCCRVAALLHVERSRPSAGGCAFAATRFAAYRDSFITLRTGAVRCGAALIRPTAATAPAGSSSRGLCARFHVLTSLGGTAAGVTVHLGIRRMDGPPRRSIREFRTVRSTGRRRSGSFRNSNYSPPTTYMTCADIRQRPVKLHRCYVFRFVVVAFLRPDADAPTSSMFTRRNVERWPSDGSMVLLGSSIGDDE